MMAFDSDFDQMSTKGPRRSSEPEPPIMPWSALYLANLPLPMFMGFCVAYGPGVIGMAVGIAGLYLAGRGACRADSWGVLMFSYGGTLVAGLQMFPVLQLIAGMLGVGTASALGQGGSADNSLPLTAAGGLIATLVTGVVLIACATVAGFVLMAFRYAVSPSFRAAFRGEPDGKCGPW